MPGEHAALANIPSGLSAIGAEDGGRGCGLRISPLEGDAHRSALKAECGVRWALACRDYLTFEIEKAKI